MKSELCSLLKRYLPIEQPVNIRCLLSKGYHFLAYFSLVGPFREIVLVNSESESINAE